MNIAGSSSGLGVDCDITSGCSGWIGGGDGWTTGSLVLSIVVTLILVGALFYYVRQRVEILETSQKEQIHIMQSFIASIGEQFHRMNGYIQHKLGGVRDESREAINEMRKEDSSINVNLKHGRAGSRIDISDDDTNIIHLRPSMDSKSGSDSDSDSGSDSSFDGGESNDSKSSNTTRDSWSGNQFKHQSKQIKIYDMDNTSAVNDVDDGIKVVEIDPQFILSHSNNGSESGGSESRSDSSSESCSESGSESGSDSDNENENENIIQDIHVIKVDSGLGSWLEPSEHESAGSGSEKEKGAQKKTVVLDLNEDVPDIKTVHSVTAQYSSLTIKQLRQLVKKKSILVDGETEISKMKREQLIELLLSSNPNQQ